MVYAKNHHNHKSKKHILMDQVEPIQVANEGPITLENVDASKLQIVESHSHPSGSNIAYFRYQP